jgi:HD-GYP domain-containing protein (c-di-GMP phosphodiesterase class II)
LLVRITPKQAVLGMCVEGLEDGWLSHPFWRERFVIKTLDDLARVRDGGTNLFIDPERGTSPPALKASHASAKGSSLKLQGSNGSSASASNEAKRRVKNMPKRVSSPPLFGPADKMRAIAVAKRSKAIMSEVFDDCRRGHPVVMPQITSVVQEIANTLDQNSAAFTTVTRLREKDGYTYTHSIAVCALMITMGRAMNATPEEVCHLGVAGMLHDIGKLSIDKAILNKPEALDADEKAIIKLHPEAGHRLLADDPRIPAVALDVCLHHHERLDGTGYPFGLQGDQLTTAARIATICDTYDAMTSNRPYKRGRTPIDAITEMASLPDKVDQHLLFKFMRGIGAFPIGELVRLRSNQLGVIVPTTSANSRPVARAFYNIVDCRFADYVDVTISESFADDQVMSLEEPSERFGQEWSLIKDSVLEGRPLSGRLKGPVSA